jgi:hypothetical protein
MDLLTMTMSMTMPDSWNIGIDHGAVVAGHSSDYKNAARSDIE